MKPFIHDDFLLQSETAKALYRQNAALQPIIDYHCHLPPQQILDDHQFLDIAEMWLGGDHYKWRAMRSNGVDERFCTGVATPREKFDAWVATVPYTLRNPLYHWSHLELSRYFDLDCPIVPENADTIWEHCNERLPTLSVRQILDKFKVAAICTTDDPADSLDIHEKIAASGIKTRVYPTYRPDKAMAIDDSKIFREWCDKLTNVSGISIHSFGDLISALEKRHADFHDAGGRLSDHGLETIWSESATEDDASRVFNKVWQGQPIDAGEKAQYCSYLMGAFGRWDAKRGWTKQLHLGAMRNNNARMFRNLGPDTGFDSIGDSSQVRSLGRYLDSLDATDELPKTILYNLNPADNYAFATMIGNFQDGSVAGKIQLGSGWWFLDQEEAMRWQMNALSNLGLLRRFVGMLTDSRSFLSFPRHEYFRRILCDLLGADVEKGRLPADMDTIGSMVEEICFSNARDFFKFELNASYCNR